VLRFRAPKVASSARSFFSEAEKQAVRFEKGFFSALYSFWIYIIFFAILMTLFLDSCNFFLAIRFLSSREKLHNARPDSKHRYTRVLVLAMAVYFP
jgi:hypothetical protein